MKPDWKLLRLLFGLSAALSFLNALWPVVVRHQPRGDWHSLGSGVVSLLVALLFHQRAREEASNGEGRKGGEERVI
jgi:hypothetical protein